jgi:hypothetical protein
MSSNGFIPVQVKAEDYEWYREASARTGVPIAKLVRRALQQFSEREGKELVEALTKGVCTPAG